MIAKLSCDYLFTYLVQVAPNGHSEPPKYKSARKMRSSNTCLARMKVQLSFTVNQGVQRTIPPTDPYCKLLRETPPSLCHKSIM